MTPLQHEPSAHAPWMRTIFGRVFTSGSLRGRFQMTKQIRLCLPARWDGIRSTTALRITRYDEQGRARGRSRISERKTTAVRKINFFYPNGGWWRISGTRRARNVQSRYGYPGGGLAPHNGHKTRPRKGPEMNVPGMSDQRDL